MVVRKKSCREAFVAEAETANKQECLKVESPKSLADCGPDSRALEAIGTCEGTRVNLRHETRLIIFTNFWFAISRFQILKNLSDKGLADELEISPHTIKKWREIITATNVIDELISLGGEVGSSRNVDRTLQLLRARRSAVENLEVACRDEAAGGRRSELPVATAFNKAVLASQNQVLANLVMGFDSARSRIAQTGAASARTIETADSLGKFLIGLYTSSEPPDFIHYREGLASRLSEVSRISARLSLHAALDMQGLFSREDSALREELGIAVVAAKQDAVAYVAAIYRRLEIDDASSERLSFLSRLADGERIDNAHVRAADDPLDDERREQAKRADRETLERLVDALAEVRLVEISPRSLQ